MYRWLIACLLAAPLIQAQTPCPADVFLDVSKYEGAGPGYPRPELDVNCDGDELVVHSNGIPHYEFVQITPNPLLEQDQNFRVPLNPERADKPIPIPLLGSAGFAVNGLVIYGPNEGPIPAEENFGDPIYNSIMDACMGHTALAYHYHALVQKCLSEGVKDGAPSPILGYAFDGFPIRGPWGYLDAECRQVVKFRSGWQPLRQPHTDSWDAYDYVENDNPAQLDICNGRVGPDGKYSYHITKTWPYIMGCYVGDPVGLRNRQARRVSQQVSEARPPRPAGGRRGGGGPPGGRRPGPEQVAAAAAKLEMDENKVARALRVDPGNVRPVNMAASARTLGVDLGALRDALGAPGRGGGPPRVNQNPPGEPECFFRCGQSDEEAVGCGLTPEFKVICHRPCDNNKCG